MGPLLTIIAALCALVALDVLLGLALRRFYRRWVPTGGLQNPSESDDSLRGRFKRHLKTALDAHYLFNDHKDVRQEDGRYRKTILFDPYAGWRWGLDARVFLDRRSNIKTSAGSRAGLYTDRFGILQNDPDRPVDLGRKDADVFRVFVLGGSYLAGLASLHTESGTGIANDGTITAVTERLLGNDVGRRYEVVNLGVHAYRSINEFAAYATEFSHYPHDLVIAFHGYTDAVLARLDAPSRTWSDAGYSPVNVLNLISWNEDAIRQMRWLNGRPPARLIASLIVQSLRAASIPILARFAASEAVRWRRRRKEGSSLAVVEDAVPAPGERTLAQLRAYADRLVANDLRISAIAAVEGVPFVSILQPILITKRTPTEQERAYLPDPSHTAQYRAFYEAARERYADRHDAFATFGAASVDWSGLLDDRTGQAYSDVVHYSDTGIREIAKRLADLIRSVAEAGTVRGLVTPLRKTEDPAVPFGKTASRR